MKCTEIIRRVACNRSLTSAFTWPVHIGDIEARQARPMSSMSEYDFYIVYHATHMSSCRHANLLRTLLRHHPPPPHLCPRKPVGGGPYHGSKLSVNGSGLWSDDFDVTTTIKR